MARSNDIKQRTIKAARELFFQQDYTHVSINDIIKKADISKKTLYRYFECKDDILIEVVDDFTYKLTSSINEFLMREDIEFPEKLKIIFTNTAVALSKISPCFMNNIRYSSPEAWKKVTSYKRDISKMCFSFLMDEGIKKGHISKNINKDIALITFLSAVESLFDPSFLDQLPKDMVARIPRSPKDLFDGIVKVIYEGILSEEAKKKYLYNV
ncbi:MAG TPA: TetR/AcrR family transcriptional regulator [Bacteroidales bacterium]|nr:TetR/AcrR family transcriptional regulator [Bacteroidales bacterium]HPS18195.1 TetR/AcrR family transcriptional regulator [Bacteroidales bacterium]